MSTATHQPSGTQPTGRPLDAHRDVDLRRAALELVAEVGYDRLTIDAVAARAKAGKATVYRRWHSKADLVADAFLDELFGGLEVPDTGCLRDDLTAIASHIWVDSEAVPRARALAGLVSALLGNPELRGALHAACSPPQAALEEIVGRAVARGEISPPSNPDLIGDLMPSMCIFHLVTKGEPPDAAFCEAVIDHILLPALRGGPSPEKLP